MLDLLPRVPVRHWVLTLPEPLRTELAARPELVRKVGSAFGREVFTLLREESGLEIGRSSRVHCGGVTVAHRADAALAIDVHFHALVLDGIYLVDGDETTFHPLPDDPSRAAISRLLTRLQRRLRPVLGGAIRCAVRHGAAAGPTVTTSARRVRLQGPARPRPPPPGRATRREGLRVHAGDRVSSDDRLAVVRLARYVTRPTVDPGALSMDPAGTIRYRLAHPFSDGTTHVELSPAALAQRLQALVPGVPTPHLGYHGVLAPRAAARWRVVPGQLVLVEADTPSKPGARRSKARAARPSDPLQCPKCGGAVQVIAVEEDRNEPPPWPVSAARHERSRG